MNRSLVASSRSRATPQASAVEAALASSTEFRTAQDLHAQLRADGIRIGLTTVYRRLQALVDAAAVDVVRTPTGELAYRRCVSADHHHHLVCRHCSHTVEIEGPEVEAWLDRIAAGAGFSDIAHTLEIAGSCSRCTANRDT